jgi:hypothetical protein
MGNHGGLDQAYCAVEFIRQRVPMADPKRTFAVGRGLQAVLALDSAAFDPRITACVAVDPIADLTDFPASFSAASNCCTSFGRLVAAGPPRRPRDPAAGAGSGASSPMLQLIARLPDSTSSTGHWMSLT